MPLRARVWSSFAGLCWAIFASATVARHFAGSPDAASRWLSLAPIVGAGVMLGAVGLERYFEDAAVAVRVVEWSVLVLISWRSLWMMFSWDGLFYFPVWCLLGLAMLRQHTRAWEAY